MDTDLPTFVLASEWIAHILADVRGALVKFGERVFSMFTWVGSLEQIELIVVVFVVLETHGRQKLAVESRKKCIVAVRVAFLAAEVIVR